MPRLRHISMYLVFPIFTAKPTSLQAFNNTSAFFLLSLPVKIVKTLLHSPILATNPAHLNLLDSMALAVLGKWYRL